jgi:hypothetical protein
VVVTEDNIPAKLSDGGCQVWLSTTELKDLLELLNYGAQVASGDKGTRFDTLYAKLKVFLTILEG